MAEDDQPQLRLLDQPCRMQQKVPVAKTCESVGKTAVMFLARPWWIICELSATWRSPQTPFRYPFETRMQTIATGNPVLWQARRQVSSGRPDCFRVADPPYRNPKAKDQYRAPTSDNAVSPAERYFCLPVMQSDSSPRRSRLIEIDSGVALLANQPRLTIHDGFTFMVEASDNAVVSASRPKLALTFDRGILTV
jgi:hypothetical protein